MILSGNTRIKSILLFFILCMGWAIPSHAAEQDSIKEKKVKIYPLPAFGYAPETRWYIGAVALFNFHLKNNLGKTPSSFKTEFNITQNKQWILTADFEIWSKQNKYYISGENGYYDFPEDYWGIGSDTKEENKINYEATRLEIDDRFLINITGKVYAGLRVRYHNMEIIRASDNKNTFNTPVTFYAAGFGPSVLIDKRDHVFYPTIGYRLNFSAMTFQTTGNKNMSKLEADLRFYTPIHRKGVAAIQLVSENNFDSSPIRMLPLIGNESIMRGYYQGRYRDQYLLATQVEYRAIIWRWLGMAAFAGGGTVLRNGHNNLEILPSYGGGVRIRLDKKDNINLRFDYGIGKSSDGFYVSFGEAF